MVGCFVMPKNGIPPNLFLSLEGFFMRWSKTIILLLIRSGSYIHGIMD